MEDLEESQNDATTVAMAHFISIKYVPGLQIYRNKNRYTKKRKFFEKTLFTSRFIWTPVLELRKWIYEIAFFVLILSREWQSVCVAKRFALFCISPANAGRMQCTLQ